MVGKGSAGIVGSELPTDAVALQPLEEREDGRVLDGVPAHHVEPQPAPVFSQSGEAVEKGSVLLLARARLHGGGRGRRSASPRVSWEDMTSPTIHEADTFRSLDEALSRYVRPDTFPLGIRMLSPGEPVPDGVRIPTRDVGEHWIVCQSIGISRRYGWSIAVGKEDVICPLASVSFGFRPPNASYDSGELALGMYCSDSGAAQALEAATWRFAPGRYERLCVAPLAKLTFEPHVVAVYGNSAQVMRLVNAALHARGGRIESSSGGRLDCAELVIQTMQTGEPKVVVPCNGDRVFGMAQDTEMAFAFPADRAAEIVTGLEATHQGGVRFPIPVAMRSTVTMPPKYRQLFESLEGSDP
jgi:uncharacterized protein (DUF169 family)